MHVAYTGLVFGLFVCYQAKQKAVSSSKLVIKF
jgi:hypothetical protein